jgi:thioredoxin reductase (NADPH)
METRIALVGAGPIGIELATAFKSEGLSYVHLDAGAIGATIAWYAPYTRFFSSPERIAISGVPLQTPDQTKATREEYLTYLRSVVQQFDLQVRTFERVQVISRVAEDRFLLETETPTGARRSYRAEKVVLAIGDMHRPCMLDIPGEDLAHVSHYLEDPHSYFGRRVLIVGGKNSAVEAAIRLCRLGAKVTLSYRGAELDPKRVKFWILPEIAALIRDGLMTFLPNTVPRQIGSETVLLESLEDGSPLEVDAEAVLLLTGYAQDPTLFEQLGITLEGPGRKPHYDENTMETDVPGVYVAGTGSGGTQLGGARIFIENCHVHVQRIVAHLTGREIDVQAPVFTLPES